MRQRDSRGPFIEETRRCEHGKPFDDQCAECDALSDDANREMGLPEGVDWGNK